jgi:hypothetical protein
VRGDEQDEAVDTLPPTSLDSPAGCFSPLYESLTWPDVVLPFENSEVKEDPAPLCPRELHSLPYDLLPAPSSTYYPLAVERPLLLNQPQWCGAEDSLPWTRPIRRTALSSVIASSSPTPTPPSFLSTPNHPLSTLYIEATHPVAAQLSAHSHVSPTPVFGEVEVDTISPSPLPDPPRYPQVVLPPPSSHLPPTPPLPSRLLAMIQSQPTLDTGNTLLLHSANRASMSEQAKYVQLTENQMTALTTWNLPLFASHISARCQVDVFSSRPATELRGNPAWASHAVSRR